MSDIVEILRKMQQDKECPMLVHMALSEAVREIEHLRAEIEKLEGTHSPITEEVEDILRSEIAKRDARIKDLEEECVGRRDDLADFARITSERVDQQAAEISRLNGVIAKCNTALIRPIRNYRLIYEALAAIKEEGL